jgi:E3 ubiquitin-protein ligase SHPRH
MKVAEEVMTVPDDSPSSVIKTLGIYSEISSDKLREIKSIDLDGPSFTTKIDCIARHLLWLRETVC